QPPPPLPPRRIRPALAAAVQTRPPVVLRTVCSREIPRPTAFRAEPVASVAAAAAAAAAGGAAPVVVTSATGSVATANSSPSSAVGPPAYPTAWFAATAAPVSATVVSATSLTCLPSYVQQQQQQLQFQQQVPVQFLMQYRQQQQQQQFQQYRPINAPAAPAPPPRTARRSSLIGSNNVNLASAALSSSGGGGGGVGGAVQPVFYSPTLSTPGGIGDTGTMIVRCSSLGALNTLTSSSAEAAAVADSSRRRPRLVEQQQQALAGATGGGSDVVSLTDTDSQVGGDDLGPLESPGSPPPMSTTPLTQPLQQQHEASLHQLPQSQQQHQQRSASTIRHVPAAACKFYLEHHFENLMKHHHERIKRRQKLEEEMNKVKLSEQAQEQLRQLLSMKESRHLRMKRSKLNVGMFHKHALLGVGAFGEVHLVRKKDNDQLYAMKTLRKSQVALRNQAAHVNAERDILGEADNEWIVKLYYSFQDEKNLYFVMEYIPGGDLMSLLIKKGIFEENLSRFYMAEMTLAIESVHRMGFCHRDIKPDNVLLCSNGHIKLTDFGLCTGFRWSHNSTYWNGGIPEDSVDMSNDYTSKPLERRKRRHRRHCQSLVGTPNYIAPEILQRRHYTKSCDWWSLGVIAFEMMVGHPPFLARSPAETQHKVINWRQFLHVPPAARLRQEASDIIYRLCADPGERLSDPANIKAHPFFCTPDPVNWDTLLHSTAPYVPLIRDELDTSNFDPVEEDARGADSDGDDTSEQLAQDGINPHEKFPDFTYRRFFDSIY
ncbi:hypothetical protein BOX15_Mlig027841g1, partial [Macrostomum lignano]